MEWSCPLCTLLNQWEDKRCAACDHERDEITRPHVSASAVDNRPVKNERQTTMHPFFYVGTASNWRNEPRLRNNTRQSSFVGDSSSNQNQESKQEAVVWQPEQYDVEDSAPTFFILPQQDVQKHEREMAVPQANEEDEAPCFRLLGLDTSFPAYEAPQDDSGTNGVMLSHYNDPQLLPNPSVLDERVIDEKLAEAGLKLSDSEEEELEAPKALRRHHHQPIQDEEDDAAEEDPPSGPTWECAVCTNFNPMHLKRCELCDVSRNTDDPQPQIQDDVVDLVDDDDDGSEHTHEEDNDSDFEELFAPAGIIDVDESNQGPLHDGYNSVEDISDGESNYGRAPPMETSTARPHLREFEHFVCVEDLRTDPGCKIDYRSMFGDPKVGKSYADRLQKRRQESQRRKRAQEAKKSEGVTSSRAKTKRKAQESKARGAATKRRASTGKSAASRQRDKKPSARRSSASVSNQTHVDYYDDAAHENIADVTAMSWEGIGSAAYH